MTTQQDTTFPFYSGNVALDCDPTPGSWDGDIFTAADGSKWRAQEGDPDPSIDGTDTHYLVPATNHQPYFVDYGGTAGIHYGDGKNFSAGQSTEPCLQYENQMKNFGFRVLPLVDATEEDLLLLDNWDLDQVRGIVRRWNGSSPNPGF